MLRWIDKRFTLGRLGALGALALVAGGCGAGGGGSSDAANNQVVVAGVTAETCMGCHNGSQHDDYAGPGLENPHPFGGQGTIACTGCHGGNPRETDPALAHVPPPPEIGDADHLQRSAQAYFNALTLSGVDKYPAYSVAGVTYTALDYLQFVNPGDLRVTAQQRGCGLCHAPHSEATTKSPLFTWAGIAGGAGFSLGEANLVTANAGLYLDTAADYGFRAQADPAFAQQTAVGAVPALEELPVHSGFGKRGPDQLFENHFEFTAPTLDALVAPDGRVQPGSPLSTLFREQVDFTCGDCHLGGRGNNNRAGDYRSSGCTACHMRYSLDGRARTSDPNMHVRPNEPVNPDAIRAPEKAHVNRHLIANVAKKLPSGEQVKGIEDYACAGCHRGSNRTVLQYWGIRLDQNADVDRGTQYPANPRSHTDGRNEARLFDPAAGNLTFNGRNASQYAVLEDYDGDGRDDTPPDVHYEAGLGCIDCHGSADLHAGTVGAGPTPIVSKMEQVAAIECESCHGTIGAYAQTVTGTAVDRQVRALAVDRKGNPITHVYRDAADGEMYLISKLDGRKHYVRQTRDVVWNNGKRNPMTGELLYSAKASFAMGRVGSDPTQGMGPVQAGSVTMTAGFSHTDNIACYTCHGSWMNTCTGCHLKGQYNTGNNFSWITGERIVYQQTNADFTYQSPVFFQLAVNEKNQIAPTTTNTEVFFQYRDIDGKFTKVFAFSDRTGRGMAPVAGGAGHPSLVHNTLTPHSIRGKVTSDKEGPRYCVACHLTQSGLAQYGAQYAAFKQAMATENWGALDFDLLREHIGRNPGNQLDSPLWVHAVAGLGSGLFLFEARGAPVNPFDRSPNRPGCFVVEPDPRGGERLVPGPAPADVFDPVTFTARVALNLDRIVEPSGVANGSNNHTMLEPGRGPNLRDGATDPERAGPLGARLIRRLTEPGAPDGIVLDSWIDADGVLHGGAQATVK